MRWLCIGACSAGVVSSREVGQVKKADGGAGAGGRSGEGGNREGGSGRNTDR